MERTKSQRCAMRRVLCVGAWIAPDRRVHRVCRDVTIRVGDTGTNADSICAAHLDASQAGPPPGVRKNVACNGRYVRLGSPQWLVASEFSALPSPPAPPALPPVPVCYRLTRHASFRLGGGGSFWVGATRQWTASSERWNIPLCSTTHTMLSSRMLGQYYNTGV